MARKVLLLVNTGTPDSPDKAGVKRYLKEFLNDPYVIDLPYIVRKILVNLIIVPFRTAKSAMLYSKLWTEEGSPLKINLEKLTARLNGKFEKEYLVLGAMRYGNPSVSSVLMNVPGGSELTVLPLFPQYAAATTGSVIKEVMKRVRGKNFSKIRIIEHFCSHHSFIDVFSGRIKTFHPENFEHIIFSYHSLPERHIEKIHPGIKVPECGCDKDMPANGEKCYRAQCYMTTRLIASRLDLAPGSYSTTFQSRLSGKWLKPFTDEIIKELAGNGIKRVLVVSPSFVSDCLETTIEIGDEYRENFLKASGEDLVLVESLNYEEDWCYAIMQIVESQD